MVNSVPSASTRSTVFKLSPLFVAIASQLLFVNGAAATPAGGTVVGGSAVIEQSGLDTTITQDTDRLAIDWASFNVAADERVEFVQPSETSVALNRILDMNGSQILGRIDANGQVILMNPNGIFFGADATVNVGSLVATGLAIDTSDFMNGDLLLQAAESGTGAVVNRGIINAATGGNVGLIGKQVANSGLISANLGHVALAAGTQAVVTFDDQGLLGVRVDEAALQAQLGMPAVLNSGTIEAAGGKILLTGSVSQDLFARAVNAGDLADDAGVVVHDDGSFTLGAGVDVLNTGVLSASSTDGAAGDVTVVGQNVHQRGIIEANQNSGGEAGGIHLEATDTIALNYGSSLNANGVASTGDVVVSGDRVIGSSTAQISTSGDADLTGHLQITTPAVTAQNLSIRSVGTVRQAGALDVGGTTHLVVTAEADVRLSHQDNDFNRVTMDTGHTSFVSLSDANDINLGSLDLLDSIVYVNAAGAIRQETGTAATLDGSDLHLAGAVIELGGLDAGSGVRIYNGWLDLQFSESIYALGSVSAPGEFNYSLVTAKGSNDVDLLMVRSLGAFELAASLEEFSGISIGGLTGATASLASVGEISQTGAIRLSSGFNLNMGAGGSALLNHQGNDFRSVNMRLGHTSVVELTDANDILVDSLNIQDSRVALTSLGSNSMISQLANASIDLYDSTLEVSAARIYLGDKANTPLRLHGFSDLQANYARGARIIGTSSSPAEFPEFVSFLTSGDFGATSLNAQGHGNFALNVSGNDQQLNIHQLRATNAQLSSVARVRQTGALELSGTLHLNLAAEADVQLTHTRNQLNKVTATTAYTSNLGLHDSDSLILGELDLADSNVTISAGGAITQEAGTAIRLADTGLRLDGFDVLIGRLDEGGGVILNNSLLEIFFQNDIEMVDAISTGGEFDFSLITVQGTNDLANELGISQSTPFSVQASLNADGAMSIGELNAENLELSTISEINQTGKIQVSGELILRAPVGGLITLENPENDFNLVSVESGHATAISLIDANDLLLGNWNMSDTSVTVRSLGEQATVSQVENTDIVGSDSDLTIYAANIDLGAQGTASISLSGIGMLRNYFSESLTIDGQILLGGFSSYLGAEGTDGANRITIGQFANVDITSEFEDHLIDLKGGDDTIEIFSDFHYGFYTGSGQDRIQLVNNEMIYTVEDFDSEFDEILISP